jgi:Uma2 family endonuclease
MTKLTDPGRSFDQPGDPFFYGWRPVQRTRADGSTYLENIPLTQKDVLHPQEGDVIVQNTAHDRDTVYLREVFRNRLLADPAALVLHDAGVDLGLLGIALVCPDICVVFGVQNRDAQRSSFDTVAEGARIVLIVEVVSPSTRANDFGDKMVLYHQAQVPMYVIVDRLRLEGPVTLRGYRLAPDNYEELNLDERGRLRLESLGLWLGIGPNRVVCFDENGEVGDYDEVTRRLIAADQAREAAEAEATQAKRACEAAELEATQAKRACEAAELEATQAKRACEAAEAQAQRAREAAEAKIAQEQKAREAAEMQAADAKAQMAKEKQAREAAASQIAELQARLAALEAARPQADPPTP